ncbi:MAG: hypothetical protein O7H41_11240 [Planctomycetota bacterium]|nr:hypothetical protein [Planctomycetota bacterium]
MNTRRVVFALVTVLILGGLWTGVAGRIGFAQDEKKLFFLEITYETPKELYLRSGHGGEDRDVFWYFPYTLKNKDAEDHKFFLQITAETNRGVKYRDGFHPLALDKIRKMNGNQADVYLKDGSKLEGRVEIRGERVQVDSGTSFKSVQSDDVDKISYKLWAHTDVTMPERVASVPVTGERRPLGQPYEIARPVIRAGETRQCVAIFPRLDAETDLLTISVFGLTNDILVEPTEPHRRKITERIYQIVYERPGDEFFPSLDKISLVKEGWVDRERIIKTDLRSPEETK